MLHQALEWDKRRNTSIMWVSKQNMWAALWKFVQHVSKTCPYSHCDVLTQATSLCRDLSQMLLKPLSIGMGLDGGRR
eukprot:2455135-Amphidinium_carterae.1